MIQQKIERSGGVSHNIHLSNKFITNNNVYIDKNLSLHVINQYASLKYLLAQFSDLNI